MDPLDCQIPSFASPSSASPSSSLVVHPPASLVHSKSETARVEEVEQVAHNRLQQVQSSSKEIKSKEKTPAKTSALLVSNQTKSSSIVPDLSHTYIDIALNYRVPNGKVAGEIYRIALALLPLVVRQNPSLTVYKDLPVCANETSQQRRNRWIKAVAPYRIYEVTSLTPHNLCIAGQKTSTFLLEFKKRFNLSLEGVLHSAIKTFKKGSLELVSQPSLFSQEMLYILPDEFSCLTDKELQQYERYYDKLLNHLAKECEKYQFFPQELIDIWDLISLAYLVQDTISFKTRQTVMDGLAKHWERMQWQVVKMARLGGSTANWQTTSGHLKETIQLLKCSWMDVKDEQISPDEYRALEQVKQNIQKLQQPLIEWLSCALTLKTEQARRTFYHDCTCFTLNILQGGISCHVVEDHLAKLFEQWWFKRVLLLNYMMSHVDPSHPLKAKLLSLIATYSRHLLREEWVLAASYSDAIMFEIISFYQLADLNEIEHLAARVMASEQIYQDEELLSSVRNNEQDYTQTIVKVRRILYQTCQEEHFWSLRVFEICHSLRLSSLWFFMHKSGKKSTINDQAVRDLISASALLKEHQQKIPKDSFNPLKDWIKALENKNYPELKKTFSELDQVWKAFLESHQALLTLDQHYELVKELQQAIKEKNFFNFHLIHNSFLLDLNSPIDLRHTIYLLLEQMNHAVIRLQTMAFLTLMSPDPHIPRIDLNVLRLQFELLNTKLCSYVEPIVLYLNAIRQIGNGLSTFQSGIEKKEHKIVLQYSKEIDLSFHLFQTDPRLFDEFAVQLNQLRAQQIESNTLSDIYLEMEDEILLEEETLSSTIEEKSFCALNDFKEKMPLENSQNSPKQEEVSRKLQEAFLPRNTRRIMRNLKDLFKELGNEGGYALKWGKGDHRKLYINGVPIVLPKHAEWKPGTAGSIQSAIKEQLMKWM